MVAIKEREEARLRAGRALDAAEADVVARAPDVAQVPEQLLEPERRALADGRQLRGLEVREAEGGQVCVLCGKGGEPGDHNRELVQDQGKRLAEEDQIRVAGEVGMSDFAAAEAE